MKRSRRLFAILTLALMLWASHSSAQGEDVSAGEVSRVTTEVSQEIFSPFCPGKTLAMCPSPAAAEVRRDIQDMAREGLEKEAIKARIIKEYGEEFRLTEPPLTDNLGLLTAIGGGFALAGLAVWAISRRRRDEPTSGATSEDEVAAGPSPAPSKGDAEDPYLEELRAQYRD